MAKRVRIVYEGELLPPPLQEEKGKKFAKGHAKVGGRTKGTENKVKALLKDALIMAAELEGQDRNGKDGLIGFLRMAARKELTSYLRLLERLLPYQLTGKDGGPMQVEHSTKQQLLQRFKERGLPVPVSLLAMDPESDTEH